MSVLNLESPARGGEFFDKEEEISLIVKYIDSGEHIVILGLRKVGKNLNII